MSEIVPLTEESCGFSLHPSCFDATNTRINLVNTKNHMKRLQEKPELYIATAATMLEAEGMFQAAAILKTANIEVEETGYDNWDGGTTIWTLYLEISPIKYAQLASGKDSIEKQIATRLKPIVEKFTTDWINVSITPQLTQNTNWRRHSKQIPLGVRKNIFDGLRIENVSWFGELGDVEFLERVFDLTNLPSYDNRFQDAAGDIWQHRVNNDDWDDNWIFEDERFELLHGSSDVFLKFLCEIVHPVVRQDRNASLKIVAQMNDQLKTVGWQLTQVEKIAGRPRFSANPVSDEHDRAMSRARSVADALDAGWMKKEIERLENAIENDPALAIGTAKELVESCCKTILSRKQIVIPKTADLPQLTKMVSKELNLVLEGISDEAKGAETIRLILRNLTVLTKYLAELRGLYGSGHGRGDHKGLQARHARLAVGTAVTFIDFVSETYHRQTKLDADES